VPRGAAGSGDRWPRGASGSELAFAAPDLGQVRERSRVRGTRQLARLAAINVLARHGAGRLDVCRHSVDVTDAREGEARVLAPLGERERELGAGQAHDNCAIGWRGIPILASQFGLGSSVREHPAASSGGASAVSVDLEPRAMAIMEGLLAAPEETLTLFDLRRQAGLDQPTSESDFKLLRRRAHCPRYSFITSESGH
jgi:hypothetical protein